RHPAPADQSCPSTAAAGRTGVGAVCRPHIASSGQRGLTGPLGTRPRGNQCHRGPYSGSLPRPPPHGVPAKWHRTAPPHTNRGPHELSALPRPGRAPHVAVPDSRLDYEETRAVIERSILEQPLHKTRGNKKAAADMLRSITASV